ncbi:hypothetical protein [Spirochaeta lutea]|uniref:hypothetical protein n=1 Tax=Spirochaeta lutea TaxID=1480694 RepID=UPI0012E077EE|nr:hypothetical protein [Spirochaeta lutea]
MRTRLASVVSWVLLLVVSSCSLFVAGPELGAEALGYHEITGTAREVEVTFSVTNSGPVGANQVYLSYTYTTDARTYYRTLSVPAIPAGYVRYVSDRFQYSSLTETRKGDVTDIRLGYE